jgi:Asp-tRNA(Asn)/Glu-tRNA(Gln) amidotransferase A subunit family amidase
MNHPGSARRTAALRLFLAVALALAAPLAAGRAAAEVDVVGLGIADIEAGLASGDFTSEELVDAYLERIARYESTYNAFTRLLPGIYERARALDTEYANSGPRSPLHGVPIALKDAIDMAGLPTTAGYAGWSATAGGVDLVPALDAPVVARLEAAGAIIIGKSNLPAFAADGTRANTSFAGPTYNAYDLTLAPGASSSGSATATAASFAAAGIAEETGGSIENPAGAQALVGIKPTFGLVPNVGVVPLAGSTRDVIGPVAKTVLDAALLLDVLAGPTPEDPKTEAAVGKIPPGGYAAALSDHALEGARIGLFGPGFKDVELTPETAALYAVAVAALVDEGAVVVNDPFAGSGFTAITQPQGFESIVYDFQQYLNRLGPGAAITSVKQSGLFAPDGFFGPFLPFLGLPADAVDHADELPDLSTFFAGRAELQAVMATVMAENDLDAFFFPQMYAPVPDLFSEDAYANTTVSEINILGTPGVNLSGGFYADGSPFSVQFLGEAFSEAKLLSLAYDYEQATQNRTEPKLALRRHVAVPPTKRVDARGLLPMLGF